MLRRTITQTATTGNTDVLPIFYPILTKVGVGNKNPLFDFSTEGTDKLSSVSVLTLSSLTEHPSIFIFDYGQKLPSNLTSITDLDYPNSIAVPGFTTIQVGMNSKIKRIILITAGTSSVTFNGDQSFNF